MNPTRIFRRALSLILVLPIFNGVSAEFDITRYGATPNDATDDTTAIEDALTACGKANGGTVFIPAGTFILSRRGAESPILEVPSNTTVRGEGAASILKYDPKVNQGNFWRMIGAPVATGTTNVVIRGNTIADNQITARETAISLNGALNVRIHGNTLNAPKALKQTRSEQVETDFEK